MCAITGQGRSSLATCLGASFIVALGFAIMLPRLLSPEFGLLDDGHTVKVAKDLGLAASGGDVGLAWRLEHDRGRLRPAYWMFNAAQYLAWGQNARAFFLVNSAALGLTAVCVAGAVLLASGDRLAALLTGLSYVLLPPVVENYYTLSKQEVPFALLLAVALCCWAGARARADDNPARSRYLLIASAVALLLAYFTKETAQVMVLVAATWVVVQVLKPAVSRSDGAWRVDCWFLVVNAVFVALFWIGWLLSGIAPIATGSYSQRYSLSGATPLLGALGYLVWYLRDFPLLLPLLAFARWDARRRARDPWLLWLPVIWSLLWTSIMLPWSSVLEYYLLPAGLGVAVMTGLGLAATLRAVREPGRAIRIVAAVVLALVLLSLPVTLGNSVSNARVQLLTDTANARLIDFLHASAPSSAVVLVNIPRANEYVYEVLMHLSVLRERPDLRVDHAGADATQRPGPVLIATPIMVNQPSASVRLAVHEPGARHWRDELHRQLPARARRVYRRVEHTPLLATHLQRPFCPLLRALGAPNDNLLCTPPPDLLDRREFGYGWEVYQIDGG